MPARTKANPILRDLRPRLREMKSTGEYVLEDVLDDLAECLRRDGKVYSLKAIAAVCHLAPSKVRKLYPNLRAELVRRAGHLVTPGGHGVPQENEPLSLLEHLQERGLTGPIGPEGARGVPTIQEEKKQSKGKSTIESAKIKIREASQDMILALPDYYRGTALLVWDGGHPKASSVGDIPVIALSLYNPPCP